MTLKKKEEEEEDEEKKDLCNSAASPNPIVPQLIGIFFIIFKSELGSCFSLLAECHSGFRRRKTGKTKRQVLARETWGKSELKALVDWASKVTCRF